MFNDLSQAEQIARIERLGRVALADFGVAPTEIAPLTHAENTTFRVDAEEGRFCLRVSRPGYQSNANIRSEIAFLAALRGADFRVPDPYQARVVTAAHPDVPEPRDCVLLGWQEGEFASGPLAPARARGLGRLTASLHEFSLRWSPPPGFDRQTLHAWAFHPPKPLPIDVPSAIDEDDRLLLVEVTAMARGLLNELPRDAANYGLIHADLHRANVLYEGDLPSAIDFDDLGWGFWLYDFAAALAYEVRQEGFAQVRQAMLEGYASIRPLPPRTEELLSRFIQLRLAGICTWVVSRQDNPDLREQGPSIVSRLCKAIRASSSTS